jgi:hypothetical protein
VLGERVQRRRQPVRRLEEHERPRLGRELAQPGGPLPRLARQEALEAEPVDGSALSASAVSTADGPGTA